MKDLKEIMKNKKMKPSGKHTEQWKEQAEEMTEFFGENMFPVFHKEQRLYIDEAYRVCKEKDIQDIRYFWGVIKHHKKRVN